MKTVIDLFEKINIRGRCIWFLAGHLIELLLRAPLSALRGAGLQAKRATSQTVRGKAGALKVAVRWTGVPVLAGPHP